MAFEVDRTEVNGCQVVKMVVREAYAANGNAHNPTREHAYWVWQAGRFKGSFRRKGEAVRFAKFNLVRS